MQNCSGRATFNKNYDHSEMRQPMVRETNAGLGSSSLSVDAPEFVPQKKLIVHEMAANVGPISQQPYHHQSSQQQQQPQPPSSHFQSPQHQVQQHHPSGGNSVHHNMNHHQHHHNHHQTNHMNHTPNPRRARTSVQDRLNFGGGGGGGIGSGVDHHHQQHHQQHHNIQQQHHHQNHQQQHQQQHHHPQSQHNFNQHQNHGGQQMVGQSSYQAEPDASVDPSQTATEAEMTALTYLMEVMRKLNDNPGMFETYQKELNSIYIEFAHNQYVISNAIETIFDQSICEQNFRYMGARICRLLDGIIASPNSVFRQMLCLKMNYTQEENRQFMKNEAHKVRGTTLFLAELYMQLQNDGTRIPDIANSIYQTIHLLLKKITPENIKCVCQALKLCGYELELDFPSQAAEIINILKQVKDIDVSTERLLKSVLDLSANRWGRNEPIATMTTPVIDTTMHEFTNEPVFYGPDGKIITEEESSFLSGIPAYPSDNFDEDDDDELDDSDPEMDLEMRIAFQDFVKNYSK